MFNIADSGSLRAYTMLSMKPSQMKRSGAASFKVRGSGSQVKFPVTSAWCVDDKYRGHFPLPVDEAEATALNSDSLSMHVPMHDFFLGCDEFVEIREP